MAVKSSVGAEGVVPLLEREQGGGVLPVVEQWLADHPVDELTARYIRKAASAPARRVEATPFSGICRYPSEKMGVVIQAESATVEFLAVVMSEHDPSVAGFLDQAPPLHLHYRSRKRQVTVPRYTPDFLILYHDGRAVLVEWKPESQLERLSANSPGRYVRQDGRWRCPPAETAAAQLGLEFEVHSSAEIDYVLGTNLEFLESYCRGDADEPDQRAVVALRTLVYGRPGIPLDTLLELGHSADDIYWLIARRQLYVDLSAASLSDPRKICVHIDATAAEAHIARVRNARPEIVSLTVEPGRKISWDGRTMEIATAGSDRVSLVAPDGRVFALLREEVVRLIGLGSIRAIDQEFHAIDDDEEIIFHLASEKDLAVANHKRDVVLQYRETGRVPEGESERSVRKWNREFGEDERYVALIPRNWEKGNRSCRYPEDQLGPLVDEAIARFENLKNRTEKSAYSIFAALADAANLPIPAPGWFSARIRERDAHDQKKSRRGRRAAYDWEVPYLYINRDTPRHGDRPWHIAHIDHTQIDSELAHSLTGGAMGKAWRTTLMDARTRRILANWVSYEKPSYRACMMVLRVCAYRWGRVPRVIVYDGGPEFRGTYWETLLGRLRIVGRQRPEANPRGGSVIEAHFGQSDQEFVRNIWANSRSMRDVRTVTKSNEPRRHRLWNLIALHRALEEYDYETYDKQGHPALDGESPRAAYEREMKTSGKRKNLLIAYDRAFLVATMPPIKTNRGKAVVQPGRGIYVNGGWYLCAEFSIRSAQKVRVEVRFDPWDMGYVLARYNGVWLVCEGYSMDHRNGRTQAYVEMQEQLHATLLHRRGAKKRAIVEGNRILSIERTEDLLRQQQLADEEGRLVLARAVGGYVSLRDLPPLQPAGLAMPAPTPPPDAPVSEVWG